MAHCYLEIPQGVCVCVCVWVCVGGCVCVCVGRAPFIHTLLATLVNKSTPESMQYTVNHVDKVT